MTKLASARRPLILITASGDDKPGITSSLTGILATNGVEILDIAQAVIQRHLSLSILFELPVSMESSTESPGVLRELANQARSLSLNLDFQTLSPAKRDRKQPHYHYAITLIADPVTAHALHQVTEVLAREEINIEIMKRLSEDSFGCVEITASSRKEADTVRLKKKLLSIAKDAGVDIALQSDGLYRRAKRLVVMDMDSTLIQNEVIDELARLRGVHDAVSAITEEAMNGKLDYDESLRRRCKLLQGLSTTDLEKVFERIQLTPGAEDLIHVLKKLGYRIALISGGFSFVADRFKEKLGIDFAYANTLEIQGGKLTGKVLPPIVNAQRKADLLEVIAQQERIELDQVIAVGDGANDILMLEKAGLGIAFNAKPSVREKADLALSRRNLRSILYLLGLSQRDLTEAGLPACR